MIVYKNLVQMERPTFFEDMEDAEIQKIEITILHEIKVNLTKNKYFNSIFHDVVNILAG